MYLWDVQHGDVVALQRCGGGDGVQGPTAALAQVSPCAEFRRGPRHVSWSRGVAGNSVVTAVFDDGLPCQLDVADGCDGDCVVGQPLDVSQGTVHGGCACSGGCGPGGLVSEAPCTRLACVCAVMTCRRATAAVCRGGVCFSAAAAAVCYLCTCAHALCAVCAPPVCCCGIHWGWGGCRNLYV